MTGPIRNLAHLLERPDFSGLIFGTCGPTDFDCVLEFLNRVGIVIEVKTGDSPVPMGQRLCIERFVDRWRDGGLCLVVRKEPADTIDGLYPIARLPVVECRCRGKWMAVENRLSCRAWIEYFLDIHGISWALPCFTSSK